MEGVNTRLISAIALGTVLGLGVLVAFLPFFLASRAMQAWCVELPLGSSSDQVRTLARGEDYIVSWESLYTPPALPDGGLADGGLADAGEVDAGEVDAASDAGVVTGAQQPDRTVVGAAMIGDRRFSRFACAVVFDTAGKLVSTKYDGD